MKPMSRSNVRRGQIRWANEPGAEQQVYEAALQQACAWSTVAEGERVFDFQLHGGVPERGNNTVKVHHRIPYFDDSLEILYNGLALKWQTNCYPIVF
jgi:hypothetical protein